MASAEHVDDRVVTTPTARYQIVVGGTLDSFNSASYETTDNDKTMMEVPRFQPDRFLRLANIGTADVINPWVVVNGRRAWHSADDLLGSIIRPGMTDREKAFALFGFFSRIDVQAHNNNLRVDEVMPDLDAAPGFNTFRERADPIKAVNSYYPSGCILSAANLVIMARHAGLRARLLAAAPLDGPYDQHGGAEIEYDGAYHYFDPEARTFFLSRDNETVASYADIHRDPRLVLRTHAHGFAAQECKAAFILLYREHFPPYEVPVEQWTHRMDLRLRPGEELTYRWQHEGKYRYGRNSRNKPGVPYRLASALLTYQPDLTDRRYRDGIVHEVNTAMSVGRNDVSVRTDNRGPADGGLRLRVTHGWNESSASAPPPAPRRALSPKDGALVEAATLTELVWANDDPDEVVDHHVLVSTRPDYLLPVSPNFDRLCFAAAPRFKVSRSFLRVGTTYHWKVRSRNGWGVWSEWSPTWTFTVVGSPESPR